MDVAVGIKELWSLVVSEVGASDVAVGGCRELETDVVDLLVVGLVRICFLFLDFFKECWPFVARG